MNNSCDIKPEALTPDDTFTTIKVALKEAYVPVNKLKPSSKLEPLLLEHKGIIIHEVSKIAPKVLPPAVIEETLGDLCTLINKAKSNLLLHIFVLN